MKKKVLFPRVGSVRRVSLYERPVRRDGETDESFAAREASFAETEHIAIDVLMLPRPTAIGQMREYMRAYAIEEKRAAAVPDAEKIGGFTTEGLEELRALNRECVRECVRAVHGVNVEPLDAGGSELDLETVDDPALLTQLLEDCDLLGAAADAARTAQRPTPSQVER